MQSRDASGPPNSRSVWGHCSGDGAISAAEAGGRSVSGRNSMLAPRGAADPKFEDPSLSRVHVGRNRTGTVGSNCGRKRPKDGQTRRKIEPPNFAEH